MAQHTRFLLVQGQIIPGLDKQLEGMRIGEEWSGTLPPSLAFGLYSDKNLLKVDVPKDEKLTPLGNIVRLRSGKIGRVIQQIKDYLIVDTNHEYAGKSIDVWVRLEEIDPIQETESTVWSGVEIKTYMDGDSLTYPKHGDIVFIRYAGYLASTGEIFETSNDEKPFSFQIGKEEVINGWDEVVMKMSLGEMARIYVRNDFSDGFNFWKDKIPPYSDLVFDIHLIQIDKKKIDYNKLNI